MSTPPVSFKSKVLIFKKSFFVFLAAAFLMGGFFVANLALAAHTATVTVSPTLVKGSSTSTYTFTVTNGSGDAIKKIVISIPSGFSGITEPGITCPANWYKLVTGTEIKCTDGDGGNEIASGNNKSITFSAIAPNPGSNTSYPWITVTTDTTGGTQSNTPTITVDVTPPTISSITTKDVNSDGKVETATIVFSEPVNDFTFSPSNFTIGGVVATSIDTGATPNDNTFNVIVAGGVEGTEAKNVTYTQGTGADLVGNLLANVLSGTITEIDGAAPIFLSARTTSPTTIDLTFSEDLNGTTVTNADFLVSGFTLGTPDAFEVTPGVVRLTTTVSFGTGDTPGVSYVDMVKDLADNVAPIAGPITPTDGVSPIIASARTITTTQIEVIFTEAMSAVSKDDFAVAGPNTIDSVTFTPGATTATLVLQTPIGTGATPAVSTIALPTGTKDLVNNIIVGNLSVPPTDGIAPTITVTAPAASAFIKAEKVNYTLSEAAVAASGVITFTRTGGTADATDHTCVLQGTALASGAHTDLALATDAYACVAWANPLVSGAIYTVTFNASDAAGNTATQVSNASVTFDTTAPTGAVTKGTATIYEGDLVQEVTVTYNENMDPASTPTITFGATTGVWTPSTGSWTAANVWQQNFTITDANEETAGVTINSSLAKDLAGNTEGSDIQSTFNIDTLAPNVPTIGAFTATDGTVVATYINNTNTGFTLKFTSPAANFAGTAHLYVGGVEFGTPVTVAVSAGNAEYTLTGNAQSITGLGTDGAKALTVVIVDTAGNISVASGPSNITKDTAVPTFISVALGADEYVNAAEATAGVNILITTTGVENGQLMTCTIKDAGDAHTVSPAAVAVSGNAVTIATAALTTLNDGVITARCNVSDQSGNAAVQGADTATKDVISPAAPVLSQIGATGNYINIANVAAVHVTGTAEANSTVNVSLVSVATVTGLGTATGGNYDITINATALTDGTVTPSVTATDAAGNVSTAATTPTATKDVVAPTAPTAVIFTAVGGTVVANTVNTTNINFTGGATIVAGEATDGYAELLIGGNPFPDSIKDLTILAGDTSVAFGAELSSNVGVQAQIATGGVLSVRLYDAAGNFTDSTVGNPTVTADYVVPTITSTAPATNAFIKTQTVGYTPSEAVAASTGVIVFTRTGGSTDTNSPHTCTLQGTALNTGAHTDLILATDANACVVWANPLVSSAIYTVTFNASDAAGNPATIVTNTGVTFDNVVPTLTTVTIVSNNANTALAKTGDTVTLTIIASENINTPTVTIATHPATVAGSNVNWTATYTMVGGDVEGVVPFTINFTDLATNPGTQVTVKTGGNDVTFDKTAPNVPTIGAFTATGGTVVPTYINSTNTGFTLAFTSPATEYAGTAHLYSGDALLATDITVAVVAGGTEYTLTGNGTSIIQLGADGAKSLTVKIIDAAGNVSAASAAPSVAKDLVIPIINSVALGTDEYVNAAEAVAGVNIAIATTGVEDGQLMTCTIKDAGDAHTVSPSAVAVSGNAVTIPTPALTSLDNSVITARCNVSDQSGNAAVQGTDTATKDASIPAAPVISSIATDDKINNAEKGAIVVVGTAEANSLVSVSLTNGATVTGTQQLSGGNTAYSITINGDTLNEGTVTPSVTATDAAGNVSTAAITPTALKDTLAPVFTINDGTAAGPVQTDTINLTVAEINLATSQYGFSVNGTCDVSDTYGNSFTSGNNFSIVGNNTDYLCARAVDTAGNITYQLVGHLNTDNTNPALVLGSLFTNQTLTGGLVYSINWTSSDLNFSGTPIKLEYSIDGGVTWLTIIASTENDGVYAWSVPTSINSSSAKLKITATDLAANSNSAESSTFTIAYSSTPDTTPPVVTLNSPNGAESWVGGSSHVITWTATDNVTPSGSLTVKLDYSTDGSATWNTITASTENDGAYLWTAPNSATVNALVKVTATDAASVPNSGSDLSNAVFTITAQPAQICTDAGGGNWTCSISLSAGWNLISLPVIISNTAIANVLSGITGYTAQYYDNGTDLWKTYNGLVGDLTTIADGKGYWINMTAPATLIVTGTKGPAAPNHAPIYSVLSGWNLVGFKSTISQLAATYLQNLSGSNYTLLNASNENKTNGTMDSGKGYWLWMSGTGSIVTYSE